jgi:hypothetical protein
VEVKTRVMCIVARFAVLEAKDLPIDSDTEARSNMRKPSGRSRAGKRAEKHAMRKPWVTTYGGKAKTFKTKDAADKWYARQKAKGEA